jgi:hypothetical protein
MQAVMQIAASCHISAGMLVIGHIEISLEAADFAGTMDGGASVGFVVVILGRCLRFDAFANSSARETGVVR